MKSKPFLLILLICTSVLNNYGQSMLQDYFKGNKDSLIAEANKLVNMPDPVFKPSKPVSFTPEMISDMGFEQTYKSEAHFFTVRDKKRIYAYKFPQKSNNTIILIHGVGSTGYLYNKTAGLLQKATQAEVFVLDLRGHGKSEGKSGDVEYINQYADDLADIIKIIRKQKPKGKIILAGHSMGGGVILNYQLLKSKARVDGILMFAPLIGHNSPAISQTPPAVTDSIEPFMKIHFARVIGLKMLNEVADHTHDSLPVLFFNLPENMPLRKYSYRANMSMTPEDYKVGLKSLTVPSLVIIGSKDEAFNAEAMKKAIIEYSTSNMEVIQGFSHNGIRHSAEAHELIRKWFLKL